MKITLFPHHFKAISGWIFYLSSFFGFMYLVGWVEEISFFEVTVPNLFRLQVELFENDRSFWISNNILDEILIFVITISGLINSFAAEPVEDEFITKMRYDALVWSLFMNYGLLLMATALIFGASYFTMMGFFLVSILMLFNLKFKVLLYRHYQS